MSFMLWFIDYSDDEKLQGQLKELSGDDLRSLYRNAPSDKKEIIAKIAAEKLVDLSGVTRFYDTLGWLKVVEDHNNNHKDAPNPLVTKEQYKEIYEYYNNHYNVYKNPTKIVDKIEAKALIDILKISAKNADAGIQEKAEYKEIKAYGNKLARDISRQLPQINYSPEMEVLYHMAERAGALDDVDKDAKNKFIETLAQSTGWGNTSKEKIEAADEKLTKNVGLDLDVYIKDKSGNLSLNPLFAECQELASKIKYEFPEDMEGKRQDELAAAYNQQLMANALQRATQDVLRNPALLDKGDKAAIQAKFKELIADNFSRSVVVAGLVSSDKTTADVSVNQTTGRVSYKENEEPIEDIQKIISGKIKISPMAVNLDSYQLGIETSTTESVLNLKQVSREKVPFFNKAKAVLKAAWDNVAKKGGWKKIAVNGAVFGATALAMASASVPVIAAGAAVYAGWTAANAWVTPVWDKLSAEMREKNITGFANKWKYRLSNWKRAKREKYKEPDFKQRAAWRTVEGIVVGGISGSLGIGGAGGWVKTLARQGAMVVGKGGSFARSWFKKKATSEKLAEEYSIANYKAAQAAKGHFTQDSVALGSVVAGAVFGDTIKYFKELNGVTETVNVGDQGDVTKSLREKLESIGESLRKTQSPADSTNTKDKTLVVDQDPTSQAGVGNTLNISDKKEGGFWQRLFSKKDSDVENVNETTEQTLAQAKATEEAPAVDGATEKTVEKVDYSSLNKDQQRMYDNSHRKWENADISKYKDSFKQEGYRVLGDFNNAVSPKGTVESFYDAINSGQVESCPEDMSAVEYVDKLTRLMQLAPIEQKKGIELMLKDLLCADFEPTASDKEIVKATLDTIKYGHGVESCIIKDSEGQLCISTMGKFGQYYGNQQYATLEGHSEPLPLRTGNITESLGAEVNCETRTVKIASLYKAVPVDCGCETPVESVDTTVEEDPCATINAEGEDISFGALNEVELPEEKYEVNMHDPYAEATAIKSGKKGNYEVDVDDVDGQAKRFKLGKDGVSKVWDPNGGKVTEETFVGREYGPKTEVWYHAPKNVEAIIAKLPDEPTNITKTDDGRIAFLYEFEKGRSVSVELKRPDCCTDAFEGRFYVNGKEIIIDKASADALMQKMSDQSNMEFSSIDAEEQNINEDIDTSRKYERQSNKFQEKTIKNMNNPVDSRAPEEFVKPQIQRTEVSLTPDQKTQLLDADTKFTCTEIKDGKAVLTVDGVDGLTRIKVAEPISVSYDLAKNPPQVELGESDSYTISFKTESDQDLVIKIADGKAVTTLDGTKVVLDSKSSEATESAVAKALLEEADVKMDVELHNPLTEKVVKAIEAQKTGPQAEPVKVPVTSPVTSFGSR